MPKLAWIAIAAGLASVLALLTYQQTHDEPPPSPTTNSQPKPQSSPQRTAPAPIPQQEQLLSQVEATPAPPQTPDAQRLIALLTVEDPQAAIAIIEREQLGSVADEAITTLVHQNLSAEDYASAIEWAAQITTPDLRADALRQSYAQAYRAGLLLDEEIADSHLPENVISEIKALSYLD